MAEDPENGYFMRFFLIRCTRGRQPKAKRNEFVRILGNEFHGKDIKKAGQIRPQKNEQKYYT